VLVTDVLFDGVAVLIAATASLALFLGLWFALAIGGLIAASSRQR
jgi:hypothetical protein